MELSVDREALQTALRRANDVTVASNTLPILSSVRISVGDGTIEVGATDLEVRVLSKVEAVTPESGVFVVNSRKLFEIVRAVPGTDVSFSDNTDDNTLLVKSGRSRFRLKSVGAEMYPDLKLPHTGAPTKLGSCIIAEMLDKVVYATSTDYTRSGLCGVLFRTEIGEEGTKLMMVATDGHRLSKVERDLPGVKLVLTPEEGKDVILPRKGLSELRKAIDGEDNFWLEQDGLRMIASTDGFQMSMNTLNSKFPDWRGIVPTEISKKVVLDSVALSGAIQRVSILADGKEMAVGLKAEEGKLTISSSSRDMGDGVEEIECALEGAPFEVNMSSRYIREMLKTVSGEISIGLPESNRPVVWRASIDPDFVHIIMPLRV